MKKIVDNPNLYDLLYEDVKEDIYMYIKLLKNKKEILEYGAGTGRITIPLSYANHYIDAVDLSSEMLDKLKNKIKKDKYLYTHINPILHNMCDYKSDKKYDAIIIPLTSFNYLLTEQEQEKCLQSVKDNLKKDGFAIIELLSKKTFLDTNQSEDFTFIKRIKKDEDSYYDYYRITNLDIDNRYIYQRRLFKYYENNKYIKDIELEWENRFVTIDDFSKLASKSGLVIDKIYGNCDLDDYHENSEDIFIKVELK